MKPLAGKRILITGASKGLGSVIAQAFAAEGASLLLAARDEERLNALRQTLPDSSNHDVFAADLLLPGKAKELARHACQNFGGVDIAVHAMGGGLGLRDPLLTEEELTTLFAVNLGASADINRDLVPGMAAKGWGRILHIGSVASTDAIASVGYNTVKAALAAYVRSLGRSLAGQGIVVCGILPGAFYAPDNSWRRLESRDPKAVADFTATRLPRGHIGKAEELIPLLLLLAGEGASMMAGTMVAIDAGEAVAYTGF